MGEFIAPSAETDRTFRAVTLALKLMPRQLRNELNKETRAMGNSIWRPIVDSNARTKMDRLVLAKGARVKPGNPMVLSAASSKRALKGGGGLVPDTDGRAWEFGTNARNKVTEYPRKNRTEPGTHKVRRHTGRQMPARSKGRVVYAAAAEIAPRITAYWVQSIVKKIHQAHEG